MGPIFCRLSSKLRVRDSEFLSPGPRPPPFPRCHLCQAPVPGALPASQLGLTVVTVHLEGSATPVLSTRVLSPPRGHWPQLKTSSAVPLGGCAAGTWREEVRVLLSTCSAKAAPREESPACSDGSGDRDPHCRAAPDFPLLSAWCAGRKERRDPAGGPLPALPMAAQKPKYACLHLSVPVPEMHDLHVRFQAALGWQQEMRNELASVHCLFKTLSPVWGGKLRRCMSRLLTMTVFSSKPLVERAGALAGDPRPCLWDVFLWER